MGTQNTSDKVLVTGFGLFREHKLNPSWEAIRDGRLNVSLPNIEILTHQVDVIYEEVDRVVRELWIKHKPVLTVHVGLAAFEKSIRIEQIARHGPYINDDVVGNAPHIDLREPDATATRSYSCKSCNFSFDKTCFDIDRICDKLNELHSKGDLPIPFKKSVDAGLYVCEYIYHKSLCISDRVVFIHVPDVENFKLEDITKSIESVIRLLIEELNVI